MGAIVKGMLEYKKWRESGFAPPSPFFVKQAVLLRHSLPNATWVETGTYLGQTTKFLSRFAKFVYSIEPDVRLYNQAKKVVSDDNVNILNGASEDVFPELLPKLCGNVCFWLDGHYSGVGTYKGPLDTPVVRELDCIEKCLGNLEGVAVLVDDVRLFNGGVHSYGVYPTLNELVGWAQRNNLSWVVEQDIFVAKSPA